MDTSGWRTQLQADSRQRTVNKIIDTLKKHLPFSGQEGLQELNKIAVKFEEKIYAAATSEYDYLRKISLKMLTKETKSQNAMSNSLLSNSTSNSARSSHPGQGIPSNLDLSLSSQGGLSRAIVLYSDPAIPNPLGRQEILSQESDSQLPITIPPTFGVVSSLNNPQIISSSSEEENINNGEEVQPEVMDMNGWRPTQGGVNVGEVSRSGLGVGTGGGLGCDSGDWRTPQQAVPFSNMMDTSGWKPTDQDRDNVGGGGVSGSGFGVGTGGGLGCGSGGDWRTQLQADSRQRIVHKIMDTLKRHIPFSGQEGIQELKKIAVRFEEKIYTAATSQSDYLRLISLKMLTLETKSKNAISNSLPSSSTSDPGTVEKGELSRRSRSNI